MPSQLAVQMYTVRDFTHMASELAESLAKIRAIGYEAVQLSAVGAMNGDCPAVDAALANFDKSPSVLQRFHKPSLVDASWFDFTKNELVPTKGRARLCPYYFVTGDGDSLRSELGGVLATIVPADKKIVHGMTDAILAPCSV